MKLSDFNESVERLFKLKIDRDTNHYQYYRFDELEIRLKKKLYRETCEKLDAFTTIEGYELFSPKYYEVSLSQGSRIYYGGRDEIYKKDNVNGLDYFLKSPSNEYLVFFIKNLIELANSEGLGRPPLTLNRLRNRMYYRNKENETLELFEVLKESIPRFQTLQISSQNEKNLKDFESNTSSFLFTLGFNTDLSFLPTNITEDFSRTIRIGRIRRASIDDIEAPKRKYLQDLILFYQKGISAESADLQFLSFYHILEHFFEKIYNEELIQSVQDKLTAPSFSYKRSKDLNSLIKVIQDKLKYKNEEFQINEPEALRLVLDKFIEDFEEIKQEIKTYDEKLLDYYKTNEVSFSKGNKVNFNEERQSILKNLRERIYKTRNSIVHSKETDKTKYLPFKHDKELSHEIILMRIIAEKIVIGSSQEL
ncbi:hypothetical protein [Seonamhaeicola sp. ML3]|uniref:hypothetical protein n=1 Tax=Seonamhaeicola sp. ML3 TaxID=2937786 RepID=UPI00200D6EFA|nr:hypothetical protein [Seonamhaeicola sp. ML3]